MFGSDCPVCTPTATAVKVYDITNLFIGKLNAHEQDLIRGQSARSVRQHRAYLTGQDGAGSNAGLS
jgi:hypothetical protein